MTPATTTTPKWRALALVRIMARARRTAIFCPLLLAACQPGVLQPRGTVGIAERSILLDSLAIMLAIVLPTIAATFAVAWWYRATNTRARYTPQWAYSGRLELIVWSVPLLTITLLGGVAWIGSHDLDPAKPLAAKVAPLEVQGVSLDWKWLFIYPDQHVASVNRLVIPAGTPIHFALTSASVMNAFFVPQLGSMIYTMNGMATQLYLDASTPGNFHSLSSHYSGDGFSDMHFTTEALPRDRFDAWIAQAQASGKVLDADSYKLLARQSLNVQPFTYRLADPALFQKIVAQDVPPGPGPTSGRPNPGVTPKTEH